MTPGGTEETKRQLVRAARDLLLEGGLTALSMRKVAKECGVSATAIYRHYEDKDALVAQAVVEGFRIFGSYLMDGLEEKTPLERFRKVGSRYFDFAREHSQDYRLIFMTDCNQLGMTHLDDLSKREVKGTFVLLQDRIVECQNAGVFRPGDPRALAASVWASVHGLASLIMTDGMSDDPQEIEVLIALHQENIELGLKS